jgi:hypothetical protein
MSILPKDKVVYNFQNKDKDAFLLLRDMDKKNERFDQINQEFAY